VCKYGNDYHCLVTYTNETTGQVYRAQHLNIPEPLMVRYYPDFKKYFDEILEAEWREVFETLVLKEEGLEAKTPGDREFKRDRVEQS